MRKPKTGVRKKVRKLQSSFFAYKTLIKDRISNNFGLKNAEFFGLSLNMSKYSVRPIPGAQLYLKNKGGRNSGQKIGRKIEKFGFPYKTLINDKISKYFEL